MYIPEKPNTAPFLSNFRNNYLLECGTELAVSKPYDTDGDAITVEVIGMPDFITFESDKFVIGENCDQYEY